MGVKSLEQPEEPGSAQRVAGHLDTWPAVSSAGMFKCSVNCGMQAAAMEATAPRIALSQQHDCAVLYSRTRSSTQQTHRLAEPQAEQAQLRQI